VKIVILCGGQGTRIRDVSETVPKPMLQVGGRPLLWHIMNIYASYGLTDFILCLGYKGWLIKEFFLNFRAISSDITLSLGEDNTVQYHNQSEEANWKVTLVDTGEQTQTAGRLWNVKKYLSDSENFCVTYGDGLADINIAELIDVHSKSDQLVTLTGVQPLGRFGEMELEGSTVASFNEKPNVGSGLINGGFMVFKNEIFNRYFSGNSEQSLEQDVIPSIVSDRNAGVYYHKGQWQCVDTQREYALLNQLWDNNQAFWNKTVDDEQKILEIT